MPATLLQQGPYQGWMCWQQDDSHKGRFAQSALRPILWQDEPGGRVRTLMETDFEHTNNGGVLHGGFMMSFADMALFAIAYKRLAHTHAVTLNCSFDFLGVGEAGKPIEAIGEITHETGKLIFIRALATQGDRPILNFTGTLRKIMARTKAGDM